MTVTDRIVFYSLLVATVIAILIVMTACQMPLRT